MGVGDEFSVVEATSAIRQNETRCRYGRVKGSSVNTLYHAFRGAIYRIERRERESGLGKGKQGSADDSLTTRTQHTACAWEHADGQTGAGGVIIREDVVLVVKMEEALLWAIDAKNGGPKGNGDREECEKQCGGPRPTSVAHAKHIAYARRSQSPSSPAAAGRLHPPRTRRDDACICSALAFTLDLVCGEGPGNERKNPHPS